MALVLVFVSFNALAQFPGIGRPATAAEIKAWDIDVRPDFKGLPPGAGSVEKGQQVWDGKCASCHGTFGESNEVFTPIVGGTTAEDVKSGRVKGLTGGDGRTTIMKLATISTLWDYINRAMPWNAPKTLSTEEVYAVVAYILNLADIVPGDFVLSERNIAAVQEKLPNRNGMSREHGLWDVKGKPDVVNTACMKDCGGEAKVASALPEHAKAHHGNLAAQNRLVGPVRGVESAGIDLPVKGVPTETVRLKAVAELARSKACFGCHGVDKAIVGPALKDVAAKYHGKDGAQARLVDKLRKGGSGVWGAVPMPANPDLPEIEAKALVEWILAGAS